MGDARARTRARARSRRLSRRRRSRPPANPSTPPARRAANARRRAAKDACASVAAHVESLLANSPSKQLNQLALAQREAADRARAALADHPPQSSDGALDPKDVVALIAVHALERCAERSSSDGRRAFARAARRFETVARACVAVRRRRAPHRRRVVIARDLACNNTSSISPRRVVAATANPRPSRRGCAKLDTFSIHHSSRVPPEALNHSIFFPRFLPASHRSAGRPTARETSRLVYRDEYRHQFKNGTRSWVPTPTSVARARHSCDAPRRNTRVTRRVASHRAIVRRARARVRARVRPASTRGPSSTSTSFAQSRARSRGILRVVPGVVRARSTRRGALAMRRRRA